MGLARRRSAIGALLVGLVGAAGTPAAAYPERTVTLVVPFAPGGITDVLARLTAERLQSRLKQNFIVENTVGAGGGTAAVRVAKSQPDGYTLFFATLSQFGIASFTSNISYDPIKDFKPISMIATSPFVISAGGPVKAGTLAEFIAQVKAQPGRIPYGSAGVGTLTQLSAALFLKNAGLDMPHVVYKGVAPAFQDLVAGHIAMVSVSPVEAKPFEGQQGVRLLAVTSARRTAALPNVPAVSETVKMPPVETWNGLLAPAAVPQVVIDTLSREIMAAEKDPAFLDRLAKLGVDPIVHTPAEFAKSIADGMQVWKKVIGDLGIKPGG